ncbi:TQO small subunit DoxD [Rhodanobacter sp. BL-MT-08]
MSSQHPIGIHGATRLDGWRLAAIAMLSVRFVQGWIFWGGGSRRFIYAPSKLDPSSHTWLANKFQSAMPGALLGMDRVVDYMLHHFTLMYAGAVAFSAAELIFGLFLLFGFMTRLSALVTIAFSVVLMLLFGWQGATCIDEWTMAACNFAIGVTLFVAGSAAYSVDSWLMRRNPALADRGWFQWFGSGTLSAARIDRLGVIGAVLTVLFVVMTYNHYRGSVFTPFHGGPVSPSKHHVSLSGGRLDGRGTITFTAYLDAGTPEAPANIVRADLSNAQGQVVETWDSAALAALPASAFVNDYRYNTFGPGYAGMTAEMGARAVISLPPAQAGLQLTSGAYNLVLHSVNGHRYTLTVQRP